MKKIFDYIKEHKPQTYAVCGGIIVIILLLLLCIPKKDNNVDNSNTVTETVTDTANAGPDANNVSTVEKKDEVENKINNENIDVEVVEKKDEVENKINNENITTEIVETKNDEDSAENTVVTNTSELKDDNVAEANDDNEVSTSTNNGNVSTSTGGTYPSGLRKPGVTPIDPSIGNYHGYDGSPLLTEDELKNAVYGKECYTGYKHITWTASNGVVLWLVDGCYLSDGQILRHQSSIYDTPSTEPGTPEMDAVEEFCFGDTIGYSDILEHKNDVNILPETSVRGGWANASECMEAYNSEEMMNYRRVSGKAQAAERGKTAVVNNEDSVWAIFDIETNGYDTFWQTELLNAKAWQLRWWEDDGTGTSSWQIQIYQNLSAAEWKALETMLKTCVVGPAYNDIYSRIYNDCYIGPSKSGIKEYNTQYTFNGYNISREYIEPEYGYVEYWIWP